MTYTLNDIQDEFLTNGRPCDPDTEADQYLALVLKYRLENAFRIACMKRFRTPHYTTLSERQWQILTREFRVTLQQAIVHGQPETEDACGSGLTNATTFSDQRLV